MRNKVQNLNGMRELKITNQVTNRDSISLEKYLKDISKEELLKPEEEAELARRIQKGDAEALERLTRANLRFVVSVAKQYQNHGLPLSDLINEGNLGLIKAAEKFDEKRGFKFISYAVWWIRQSIMQALVEQSRIIRLPLNKVGSFNKVSKAMTDFEQQYQREPTNEELEEILDIDKEEINEVVKSALKHQSTDAPMSSEEESGTLLDVLAQDEENQVEQDMLDDSLKKEIKRVLTILPSRDADIIKTYFGLDGGVGLTLEEIGDQFGLTRERVRQIKERSLRRLRRATSSKSLKSYLS